MQTSSNRSVLGLLHGEDQVRGLLHCGISARLVTGWGHNSNCRPAGLCQLWPAADITPLGLPPLCAKSGCEQLQQRYRLLDQFIGANKN